MRFGRRHGGLALLGLAAGLSGLAPRRAGAAALEVSPVSVDFPPGQPATILTLVNRGATAAVVQARAFAWSQAARQDRLIPTEELVLSPAAFQVAPGGSQVLRLVLRRSPAEPERAYRILLDELPNPDQDRTQIRFALRLSLPVFARSREGGRPELDWRIEAGGVLAVVNRGTRRAQIGNLSVTGPVGERLTLVAPENPYVLPGVERHWAFRGNGPRPGTVLRAGFFAESGPATVDIPVSGR